MILPFITNPNIPIPCTFDHQITKPLWNTSSPLFLAVTSVYTCLLTCLLQEIFNHFNRKPRMLCASIEFFEWMMRFKFKSIHLKSNVRYGFVGNKWHEHECESKWFMPFRNITSVRSVNVLQKIAFLMWKLFAQYAHNWGRTVEMITVFSSYFYLSWLLDANLYALTDFYQKKKSNHLLFASGIFLSFHSLLKAFPMESTRI